MVLSNFSFFPYRNSNIGLFSIDLCKVSLLGDSNKFFFSLSPLRLKKSDNYRDSWKSDNYTESNMGKKAMNIHYTKPIKKMLRATTFAIAI